MNENSSKPCLIKTSQGFCVKYKEKFLYSKYNPQKTILNLIEKIELLPGTIIIAASPVMPYGIKNLIEKLPRDCIILAVEFDANLFEFSKPYLEEYSNFSPEKIQILSKNDILNFHKLLQQKNPCLENGFLLPPHGTFKRAVKIDFSGGVQFHKELYESFLQTVQNAIGTFFKNQITLSKFARKYFHNLFRNMTKIPDSVPLKSLEKSVSKPILILGTGSSVEDTLEKIKNNFNRFFIISLDATVPALKDYKIHCDAVICEECQCVISKMFIGSHKTFPLAITGLTSAPKTVSFSTKELSYFIPFFADCTALKNIISMKNFPPKINPFGSVGITALYFALFLRKNNTIPIFFSGLDFSFENNFTHAKNSLPYKNLLFMQNKIKPIQNLSPVFAEGNLKILDKNKKTVNTTKALLNYSQLFSLFENEKNLFDIRKKGLKLNIKDGIIFFEEILNSEIKQEPSTIKFNHFSEEEKIELKQEIREFFLQEINALEEAKKILKGEVNISENEKTKKLKDIFIPREYLYLHFPDGYKFSLDLSFLKRVRAEMDFFLKEFKTDLTLLDD